METYELILRDANGATLVVYATACASEQQARAVLLQFRNVEYAHFELWCGDHIVAEGPHLAVAA